MVRTFAKSQLIRAMSFVAYFHWRMIFFVNIPIGLTGLYLVYRNLPDYREEHVDPLDIVGLILFGSGVALCSYVLEVFGEHTLGPTEILGLLALAVALLAGYGLHATRIAHPMLNLRLFRIRTFRSAVSGSFITRFGIGGIPFLFPLLYQVGLGFSPIASGLLMMPQAIAAMSLKMTMPRILARFGYRTVLVSNTLFIGLLILLFSTIARGTPVWLVVMMVFCYGFFTSLQYTSMNTLVYADVTDEQASTASSIASTPAADVDQFRCGHGIAGHGGVSAGPLSGHSDAIHPRNSQAFGVLGAMTVLSTLVFRELQRGDGGAVSRARQLHP